MLLRPSPDFLQWQDRSSLLARLYRSLLPGTVFSVQAKRGIYSLDMRVREWFDFS